MIKIFFSQKFNFLTILILYTERILGIILHHYSAIKYIISQIQGKK